MTREEWKSALEYETNVMDVGLNEAWYNFLLRSGPRPSTTPSISAAYDMIRQSPMTRGVLIVYIAYFDDVNWAELAKNPIALQRFMSVLKWDWNEKRGFRYRLLNLPTGEKIYIPKRGGWGIEIYPIHGVIKGNPEVASRLVVTFRFEYQAGGMG